MASERVVRPPQEIECLLAPVLNLAGYEQVGDSDYESVYQARWSNDEVEHFVYLSVYMKAGNSLLNPEFGIRNPTAEAFGAHIFRKYESQRIKHRLRNEATSCAIGGSFGLLEQATSWPTSYLGQSDQQLAHRFESSLNERVLPLVREINTSEVFLGFLLNDEPGFLWAYSNGAIRTAQIIALAGILRIDPVEIRAKLARRLAHIANGLSRKTDPTLYLIEVQRDWEAWSASNARP